MKKVISLLLALVLCLSLVACSGGNDTPEANETPSAEASTTEAPGATEYAIGDAFGTDSVECIVTDVVWVTQEDVINFNETHDFNSGNTVMASSLFNGYTFYGISGFNPNSTKYPYLCVTFTLQNVGKTLVEPTIQDNNWGAAFNSYGSISVIYDDGYTFDAEEGFNTTLEILGDAFKEGRIFEVPAQVYENEDKVLKVKITLPNANGETEEFIVSVR